MDQDIGLKNQGNNGLGYRLKVNQGKHTDIMDQDIGLK